MPSQRRLRLLFLVIIAAFVAFLFFTSHLRRSREPDTRTIQDFYHKTINALDRGRSSGQALLGSNGAKAGPGRRPVDRDADGDIDDDDAALARDMAERLKAAEQKAKDLANAKAPNKPDLPSEVIGVGSSAGGQAPKVAAVGKPVADGGKAEAVLGETDQDREVETELDNIFKRSPIIIFSKSYCPHSKRAKGILLEKYAITPKPSVVELDLHPIGRRLQNRLADMTGRGTVPNVMVNGKSIGGGDDMAELDRTKTLAEKIEALGGEGVEVRERFPAGAKVAS